MSKLLEIPLTELDLFGLPQQQKSVDTCLDTMHLPTSFTRIWSTSSPVEFNINLAEDEYMLMHETSLYLAIGITKRGGGFWTPADEEDTKNVTPVNNLFHSAIDRVQLTFGSSGHLIDITDYAYKAYLSTLLGYNERSKSTHLKTVGWEEDELARRRMYVKEGKECSMYLRGKLFYDFEHQCRAILGGCRVNLKISLKSPKFFLQTLAGVSVYGAEMLDVRLFSKKYKVAEPKVTAHMRALRTSNARYPMTTSCIKTVAIRSGSLRVTCDNFITGKMPNRLFGVLVGKSNYNGSFGTDPFLFKHYNLASISCFIDGVQYPNRPYNADFETGDVVDMYYNLFEALNQHDSETVCGITLQDFTDEKFVFGFNFNPDMSSGYSVGGHWNPIKQGHMTLELRFDDALAQDLHLVALCEFETLYEIDEFRNLSLVK